MVLGGVVRVTASNLLLFIMLIYQHFFIFERMKCHRNNNNHVKMKTPTNERDENDDKSYLAAFIIFYVLFIDFVFACCSRLWLTLCCAFLSIFVSFLFCCCCWWMRVFGTNSHNISLYAATNTHTHKPTRLNESQHRNRFYLTECHITFLNHFIYALFILHYYGWNINNISFKKSRI